MQTQKIVSFLVSGTLLFCSVISLTACGNDSTEDSENALEAMSGKESSDGPDYIQGTDSDSNTDDNSAKSENEDTLSENGSDESKQNSDDDTNAVSNNSGGIDSDGSDSDATIHYDDSSDDEIYYSDDDDIYGGLSQKEIEVLEKYPSFDEDGNFINPFEEWDDETWDAFISDSEEAYLTEDDSKESAEKDAESFLNLNIGYSRDSLIESLEQKGYSTENAEYAADNMGIDWYEQALKGAKDYVKNLDISYNQLLMQLEFVGFTSEQAQYGVDNCGADWYQEAVDAANSWIEYYDDIGTPERATYDRIYSLLYYSGYGFTPEQAEYALAQVGL